METVTLAELTDGIGQLQFDDDGAPINPLIVVDLDAGPMPTPHAHGEAVHRTGVVVGVGSRPMSPQLAARLTTIACPADLSAIKTTVDTAPIASVTLAGLLSVAADSSVERGLLSESLAYSTLLASREFRDWRQSTQTRLGAVGGEPVLLQRDGDVLTIRLNRPERHNAFNRAMRDGLLAGLELARLDPAVAVILLGNGSSFCSGGDLDEFGTAADVAQAHTIRLAASAGKAVHRLRHRVKPVLHGACLGAGIEVPAFAAHVVARDDAYFGLPELGLGLVPGAGGTVSLPARIGRHRTAWLALTRRSVDVGTALAWGLVDERTR